MNPNEIARERCAKLLSMANAADEKTAKRYVSLARKIAMRHRLKLGRRKFCRKCGALLEGKAKVRLSAESKTVIYACSNCNTAQRIPYRKKPKH